MTYLRFAGIALIVLTAAACTKPAGSETTAAAGPDTTSQPGGDAALAAGAVTLFNAYTARTVDAEAKATDPAKDFRVADAIYIGAVVHGDSESVNVRAEWSLSGGAVLGSLEKNAPVHTAQVVTLPPIPGGSLAKGNYMAIVSLNGKPQWELPFHVTD